MIAALHSRSAATEQAAQAFEAQALGALFQPIFAAAGAAPTSFGGGGAGEQAWKPMLVDAIATRLAATGGLGIAHAVRAEMLRMQAEANTLTNEGNTP